MKAAVKLSRKPEHDEATGIYCSPACGAQCTYDAFQQATEKANEICRELGPGWAPRVWENLGWHYSAILPLDKTAKRINDGARIEMWAHSAVTHTVYRAVLQDAGPQQIGEEKHNPEAALSSLLAVLAETERQAKHAIQTASRALMEKRFRQ